MAEEEEEEEEEEELEVEVEVEVEEGVRPKVERIWRMEMVE